MKKYLFITNKWSLGFTLFTISFIISLILKYLSFKDPIGALGVTVSGLVLGMYYTKIMQIEMNSKLVFHVSLIATGFDIMYLLVFVGLNLLKLSSGELNQDDFIFLGMSVLITITLSTFFRYFSVREGGKIQMKIINKAK